MHICLLGPIGGQDIKEYLDADCSAVATGYVGAPLLGVLIGELLRMGHTITAITTDTGIAVQKKYVRYSGKNFTFVVCAARPHAWRFNGMMLGRAVDLFYRERQLLCAAISEASPDVVHAHWSYEFAWAALAYSPQALITCHDSPRQVLRLNRNAYRAARALMARVVFSQGANYTTVSTYMASELYPHIGYRPVVIPNPIADHVLCFARARPLPSTRRIALVSNGWDSLKNVEIAFLAFGLWRKKTPNAELHVFGVPFERDGEAYRWASKSGLADGVFFHGRKDHRELIACLDEVDVLLHPSLQESFGVVLAEANGLGLPVIAGAKSGAVPWVLDADEHGISASGILTDVTSANAIEAALVKIFDADYESRSRSGIEMVARRFSPTSVASAYETLYANYRLRLTDDHVDKSCSDVVF